MPVIQGSDPELLKQKEAEVSELLARLQELESTLSSTKELQAERAAISRSMAMIEFSPDGTIQTANENFLGATGYTLEEVQGQHHRIFCTEDYAQSPDYEALWERLNSGEFFMARVHRVRKDGSDLWIEATYNPVLDEQGQFFKVMKLALDVTDTVNQDKEASANAFAASQRAEESSSKGQQKVDSAVVAMRQSAQTIRDAQSCVKELTEQAKEVANILEDITDIAAQTKLLALNASIEASRSGQHGMGFAVVAREVRDLAERTKESTTKISTVLQANDVQSTAVAEAMQTAVDHSESGLALTEEAGPLIQETSRSAADVVGVVRQLTDRNAT
jgi:methyl-accepting chemotaxis protein